MTVRFPSFEFVSKPTDIFQGTKQVQNILGNIQSMLANEQNIQQAAIRQKYLSPLLQQQLQQEQLKTQAAQDVAPYLAPEERARLSQMQATYGLTRAQTQAALAAAQKAANDIYKDPTVSRLHELSKALKRGDIDPNILNASGLGQLAQQVRGGNQVPDAFQKALSAHLSNKPPISVPMIAPQQQLSSQNQAGVSSPISQPVTSVLDGGYGQGQQSTQNDISNFLLTGKMISPITTAALQASAKAQATAAATSLSKEQQLASQKADVAQDQLQSIDVLKNSYNNAYKKYQSGLDAYNPFNPFNMVREGSVTGSNYLQNIGAARDDDISNALMEQRKLALDAIKTVHLGRMTQQEFNYIQHTLPTFGMSPIAFNQSIDRLKAAKQRDIEYNKFISYANQKGITNVNDIKSLWNKFTEENPIIDLITGNINKKNIGNWKRYLSNDISDTNSYGNNKKDIGSYSNVDLIRIARGR